jgi:hypothetical protein
MTEFLGAGVYRVNRCLRTGRLLASVTMAPVMLPRGAYKYAPTQTVDRGGTRTIFRSYGDASDPNWVARFKRFYPRIADQIVPPTAPLPTRLAVGQGRRGSKVRSSGGDNSCSDGSFRLLGAQWTQHDRAYDYYVNEDAIPGGKNTVSSIQRAHHAWNYSVNDCGIGNQFNVRMTLAGNTNRHITPTDPDGFSVIDFGSLDHIDGCGDGTTIGCAVMWSNLEIGIAESDLRFDSSIRWSNHGADDAYDIQSTATHEVGHSLGLANLDDPAHSFQTMYGFGNTGEVRTRDLGRGDVLGLRSLYPPIGG